MRLCRRMRAFQDVLRFQLHVAVCLSDLQDVDKGLSTGPVFVGFRSGLELQIGYC